MDDNYVRISTESPIFKELKAYPEYYKLSKHVLEDKMNYDINRKIKIIKSIYNKVVSVITEYGSTKKLIELEKKEQEKEYKKDVYVLLDSMEFFYFYHFKNMFGIKVKGLSDKSNYTAKGEFKTTKGLLRKTQYAMKYELIKDNHPTRFKVCMDDYISHVFVLRTDPIYKYFTGGSKLVEQTCTMDSPSILARIPRKEFVKINNNVLHMLKLTKNAITPTNGSKGAAGYDLYAAHDGVVGARSKALIKTDITFAIPNNYYGRIAPRSGLALKHSIDVGAGVIDSDYRGNIGVILFNHSDKDFVVKKGDRIAQLIFEVIWKPFIREVGSLDKTARGKGGFGSTDDNK